MTQCNAGTAMTGPELTNAIRDLDSDTPIAVKVHGSIFLVQSVEKDGDYVVLIPSVTNDEEGPGACHAGEVVLSTVYRRCRFDLG